MGAFVRSPGRKPWGATHAKTTALLLDRSFGKRPSFPAVRNIRCVAPIPPRRCWRVATGQPLVAGSDTSEWDVFLLRPPRRQSNLRGPRSGRALPGKTLILSGFRGETPTSSGMIIAVVSAEPTLTLGV